MPLWNVASRSAAALVTASPYGVPPTVVTAARRKRRARPSLSGMRPVARLRHRALVLVVAIALGFALWLPSVHFVFRPGSDIVAPPGGVAPRARDLAERHLALFADPEALAKERARMRGSNAEWD